MAARHHEASDIGGYFDEFKHEIHCKRSVLGHGRIKIDNACYCCELC